MQPHIYIDFLCKTTAYRRKHATLRKELLARAIGSKPLMRASIVDATAGMGRDSFILASLGFEIILIERSPLIYASLSDALKRASLDSQLAPIIQRLTLIHADSISWLQKKQGVDIIYLDPMFPTRSKSALVKKEMRLFHQLIGQDIDATMLLKTALACALKRVVVKRPRRALPIESSVKPSFNLCGKSSRFDIYLIQELHGHSTASI